MDFISALNQIPSGIYSLLGIVLGFGMTCTRDWYSNRDKLFCSFEAEIPYEGWEYDKTPKEGDSGKIIKMYNCGNKPLLIENISIVYKKMPIDGVLTNPVAILPYQEKVALLQNKITRLCVDGWRTIYKVKFILLRILWMEKE